MELVSLLLRLSFIDEAKEFPGVNLKDSLVAEDAILLWVIRLFEKLVSLKLEIIFPSLEYFESCTL